MSTAVIFDMDGTLFQTNRILELSLEETFELLRGKSLWDKETPIDIYRRIMGVPLPAVWETLLQNHSIDTRNLANDFFQKQLIGCIHSGKGELYPNVAEIFRNLKNNHFPIFIASNGQTEYLDAIVHYYSLQELITEMFSIQQIASQNKSELVGKIVKKYKLKKGFVVGDRLSDFLAAKDNNLISIGCRFDFAQEEELSQADYIIDDLLKVEGIISSYHSDALSI
jgi:phosphoglycolate phosphatase-like HAD superfamily hydrolase